MRSEPGHRTIVPCGIVVALTMWACRGEPELPATLIDHDQWRVVGPADDPFSHRPPDTSCPTSSWSPELQGLGLALEVDTTFCGYCSLWQPTLAAFPAGHELELTWGHGALTAAAPGVEGHFAVLLGDRTLVDEWLPIPLDAEDRVVTVEIPEAVPEGTRVLLHLHNHGDNTWYLSDIAPPRPATTAASSDSL